jgi:hypothetical protein
MCGLFVSNGEHNGWHLCIIPAIDVEGEFGTNIASTKLESKYHFLGDWIMSTSNIIKNFIFGALLLVLTIISLYGLLQAAHKVDHTRLLQQTSSQPLEPTTRSRSAM